jgi:spore coat polysaccharide biosynthesis protein SpsF (cytidylyltransferase family)
MIVPIIPTRMRVVIQARMGSSRLPGKILLPLAGEPLLGHVVRRMQAVIIPWAGPGEFSGRGGWPLEVVVATTRSPADDAACRVAESLGAACVRGPADDVLARYLQATADLDEIDLVVRATADNPVYCPRRTAGIVQTHLARSADYTCIERLSYVVPEVIRVGALRAMAKVVHEPYCREHVTPFFRAEANLRPSSPGRGGVDRDLAAREIDPAHKRWAALPSNFGFRVEQLPADWEGLRPDVRLTVDWPQEYELMAAMFDDLAHNEPLFPLEAAYAWWDGRQTKGPCQGLPRQQACA